MTWYVLYLLKSGIAAEFRQAAAPVTNCWVVVWASLRLRRVCFIIPPCSAMFAVFEGICVAL